MTIKETELLNNLRDESILIQNIYLITSGQFILTHVQTILLSGQIQHYASSMEFHGLI